jgi:hypothetical protein
MSATRNKPRRATAPTAWAPRSAIAGRAEVLVGPTAESEAPGAAVIAPPGVLLSTRDGDPPLDRDGWRFAHWEADAHGQVLIDQGRPAQATKVSLAEVVTFVAANCPQHLAWVAGLVERRLRLAIGRMQTHDHAGRDVPGNETAFADLQRLQSEADEAFAGIGAASKPFMRAGHFKWLVQGGYVAFIHGRKELRDSEREPGTPPPPARHSTLRPLFRDDEEERPRPRTVE